MSETLLKKPTYCCQELTSYIYGSRFMVGSYGSFHQF